MQHTIVVPTWATFLPKEFKADPLHTPMINYIVRLGALEARPGKIISMGGPIVIDKEATILHYVAFSQQLVTASNAYALEIYMLVENRSDDGSESNGGKVISTYHKKATVRTRTYDVKQSKWYYVKRILEEDGLARTFCVLHGLPTPDF